jgi:phage shock protein C
MVAGVCAGIAEYFGLNRKGVRLATVLLMLLPPFFAFVVITYVVLAIVLPVKPVDLYETKEQAEFWRGVTTAPSDAFGALSHRFRELNLRLERMEAHVTSREFEIDRELGRK